VHGIEHVDKFDTPKPFYCSTQCVKFFQGYCPLGSPANLKGDILKNPIVKEVAEELGKTPGQVALRWGLQKGHSVLPKSTNEARIKENLDLFNWFIPEDLLAKFSNIKQASC